MGYTILFSLCSLAIGGALLQFLDFKKMLGGWSRFFFSLALGYTTQGFIALGIALLTKNLLVGGWVTLGYSVIFFIFTRRKTVPYLTQNHTLKTLPLWERACLLLLAAIVILLSFQSMLWVDGFPYGILKGWGDGAYHMGMIHVLAQSDPFILQHPVAGGSPLTYTFFINFLSALLLHMGSSFQLSWYIPLFVYGVTLVAGLWALLASIIQTPAIRVACIVVILCGGGLGIILAPLHTHATKTTLQNLWEHIQNPRYEYTHLDIRTGGKPQEKSYDKNIVWITPVISFFSHQRSFLPGAALALIFLTGASLYWNDFSRRGPPHKNPFWWFSLLGVMPLMHIHTTLAVAICAIVIYAFHIRGFQIKNVVPVVLALCIALPQIFFLIPQLPLAHTQEESRTIVPWFGWMLCSHAIHWFTCDPAQTGGDTRWEWFLLKNFGVVFIAWVLSFFFIRTLQKRPFMGMLFITETILFILAHTLKFQPWEFDNNKILFYWWLCAIIVSGYLLEIALQKTSTRARPLRILTWSIIALFVFCGSLSGAVDVLARVKLGTTPRINDSHFGYYGREIEGARSYIQGLPSSSVIVASSYANQFIPITTGRALYLGFEGWLWSQGKGTLGKDRKHRIQAFLQTGDASFLCKDGASHIYVDSGLQQEYGLYIQENSLEKLEELYKDQVGVLYTLPCTHQRTTY